MPLFFVATPIGNLGDITLRAIRTLEQADVIAAEDTRRALKLLSHLGIKKPLLSLYRENERRRSAELLERAQSEAVAVISDAGMPLISDPGEYLLREAISLGVRVEVIPGPSAALMALALSGLSTERFAFEGFLPRASKALKQRLTELSGEPRTMIIFESPLRLRKTLLALHDALGERSAAVLRELTKLHEEAARDTLSALAERYQEPPKGECVIVVQGRAGGQEQAPPGEEELKRMLLELIETQGLTRSEAAKLLSKQLGLSKNALYSLSLE